jgi:hypothetical protein
MLARVEWLPCTWFPLAAASGTLSRPAAATRRRVATQKGRHGDYSINELDGPAHHIAGT